MALKKDIEQINGIITSYHRIYSIENIVNQSLNIIVFSYLDNNAREKEENGNNQIYKQTKSYTTQYEETLTVEDAYEYLKTLPEFEDAEDI